MSLTTPVVRNVKVAFDINSKPEPLWANFYIAADYTGPEEFRESAAVGIIARAFSDPFEPVYDACKLSPDVSPYFRFKYVNEVGRDSIYEEGFNLFVQCAQIPRIYGQRIAGTDLIISDVCAFGGILHTTIQAVTKNLGQFAMLRSVDYGRLDGFVSSSRFGAIDFHILAHLVSNALNDAKVYRWISSAPFTKTVWEVREHREAGVIELYVSEELSCKFVFCGATLMIFTKPTTAAVVNNLLGWNL